MKTHQRCVRRTPYRFTGAYVTVTGVKMYQWERRIPGDSRVEQIICEAAWFWSSRR